MDNFAGDLLAVLAAHANQTFAWCVLPNHYHALVEAADIKRLIYQLGGFTAALRTLGTPKNIIADERFSSALSSARCVRIGITGRH